MPILRCRVQFRNSACEGLLLRLHPAADIHAEAAAVRVLRCPKGCELRVLVDRSYSSIRRTCLDHLRHVHKVSGSDLETLTRAMLGADFRESPEYELHKLPVWEEGY